MSRCSSIRNSSFTFSITGAWLVVATWVMCAGALKPAGPSDRPEAYLNGTAYIRLARPISLRAIAGISFRSCVGGELFSQRFDSHTMQVTALAEEVLFASTTPAAGRREARLRVRPLDNAWHFVALRHAHQPPAILLTFDRDMSVTIANSTYNEHLLTGAALEDPKAVLLVGNLFSGCLREGPQLEFLPTAHAQNVVFGACPLTTDQCKDRKDVLRTPPVDHCYHEPCLRQGTCISGAKGYECHCTARYSGKNCEIDNKSPCLQAPCLNGGTCVEDKSGDYTCHCDHPYYGERCEMEVSLDPLCAAEPCQNNGSCLVPAGSARYVCSCLPGYTGANCETDIDECSLAGGGACLNGGRCVDSANNYTCDCAGTGYTGTRCETNVNECEEAGVCGHGVCYDTYGAFVCACRAGYTGERCNQVVGGCAALSCGAWGRCVEEAGAGGGASCVCARGWGGARCDVPPASCALLPCPPHSHCVTVPAHLAHTTHLPTGSPMVTTTTVPKQAQCVCDPGFYGAPGISPNCSSLESACANGVCLNGATCSQGADHFNCTCPPGYKGSYCEQAATTVAGVGAGKALQEAGPALGGAAGSTAAAGAGAGTPGPERCTDAPCQHATACLDLPSGFRCECEAGWRGARCEEAEGSAQCTTDYCHNGGTCLPAAAPVGALCACGPSYTGSRCERSVAMPADETAADCRTLGCGEGEKCTEIGVGAGWACEGAGGPCAGADCHNGTCVPADGAGYTCVCLPGYTGRVCDTDVDECAMKPKLCINGVCFNTPGSFQCYCRPGYTGDRCELDIDECLSSPCQHGGTCRNLENNYECVCMDGFAGKNCSVNIDECRSAPCAAGSTCLDGVNSYTCLCQDGLTGRNCETNIDDCESSPCKNGGTCRDALNGYSCECAGTGFSGADCTLNIDECAPQPCRNGATCLDRVNDYECRCYPGYKGKNCEEDIAECASSPCQHGGVCLERSNASLYVPAGSAPVPLGPAHMMLPQHFYTPFSLQNASGFECVCVEGVGGARCEVNIDECASSPCGLHGKCVDGIGAYTCQCKPGYTGDHCQTEINECQLYKPCVHGVCYDRLAAYYCECESGWGGRNCSVVLAGCAHQPCLNNGTCLPWLKDETHHLFNCSCPPGYHGTTCQKITTMSLGGNSYAEVRTTRDEGYDISFRFKTTLGNGLLAIGKGLTYFFLELANGRLNLHSSLLNKWEGVFIGSNLNDSKWQKVFVSINSSHLVLSANEEQTIYPINQNEAFNSSITSFGTTYLGGATTAYAPLTHTPLHFIGCLQDVVINGEWVLPEVATKNTTEATEGENASEAEADADGLGAVAVLHGVAASCPRAEQCQPNPCRSGGVCEDRWTSFLCTCPRPYLGNTCQYNVTAATFGHESAKPMSVVTVSVSDAARKAVHSALDISMFIRTRKPTGQIFYLGSKPRYGMVDSTLVGASLKNGEMLIQLRFNQTPEEYTVGGTRLDNGNWHLIQVVRNSTLVQVKLNGTEYFRKSISAAKQLDAHVLYLGGPPPQVAAPGETGTGAGTAPTPALPPVPAPTPHTTPRPSAAPNPPSPADYFKGVIQDVQISNGMRTMIVEFFPLREAGLQLPASFGEVALEAGGVLRGVRSDDNCASSPCLNDAKCTVTWNDYVCECPRGYKGKQCAEVEFCQLNACPITSQCRNLDGSYECLANATFDGTNTTLAYKLLANGSHHDFLADSLTITYRTKTGGTLFHATLPVGNESWSFSLGVVGGQVTVGWRLGEALPALRRMRVPAPPNLTAEQVALQPQTLHFRIADSLIKGWSGERVNAAGVEEPPALVAEMEVEAWQRLVTEGTVHLAGHRDRAPPTTLYNTTVAQQFEATTDTNLWEFSNNEEWNVDSSLGEYFKGCIGEVHIGNLLLPFFTEQELNLGPVAALIAAKPHYSLVSGRPWGSESGVGCVLCLERECQHGGWCEDARESYECACAPGWAGPACALDVDECAHHACLHGATCVDLLANYTCLCAPGYTGDRCEVEVDECLSMPCLHGGACVDEVGGYRCECGAEWAGPRCDTPRRTACAHRPCREYGTAACEDTPPPENTGNNFTCVCQPGFEGALCEYAFCEVTPCLHAGTCLTLNNRAVCACAPGYTGARCETEIDECGGGAATCQHGGRCVDALNDYRCDCAGTGYTGARCDVDVDECALGLVSCGPGTCQNLDGSYTCQCSAGYCGHECALPDPCYAPWPPDAPVAPDAGANATGPCEHGAPCEQRCSSIIDYTCFCPQGWAGKNCSEPALSLEGSGGSAGSTAVIVGVAGALVAGALAAGALLALAAQARRKRATRGTYSPSGQEYCNPRAEHLHNALKPPPEERLI